MDTHLFTKSAIARLNGHSAAAVGKAITRLKLNPVQQAGSIKLYSHEQAAILKNSMRRSRK